MKRSWTAALSHSSLAAVQPLPAPIRNWILQSPPSSSAAAPMSLSRGQIVFWATPLAPPARKLDDADQEELDRSGSLRDACLIELEQLAQPQWRALAANP
jgi:hypothetical protein